MAALGQLGSEVAAAAPGQFASQLWPDEPAALGEMAAGGATPAGSGTAPEATTGSASGAEQTAAAPGVGTGAGGASAATVLPTLTPELIPDDASVAGRVGGEHAELGIGEKFIVQIKPPSRALTAAERSSLSWRVSVGGKSVRRDGTGAGTTAMFTALDIQGPAVLVLERDGVAVAQVNPIIVMPKTLHYSPTSGAEALHFKGTASAGFEAMVYLGPKGISMQRIQIKEDDAPMLTTGWMTDHIKPDGHHPTPFGNLKNPANGYIGTDTIGFFGKGREGWLDFYTDGSVSFFIPVRLRTPEGNQEGQIFIPFIVQKMTIDASGTLTISKGGSPKLTVHIDDGVPKQSDD